METDCEQDQSLDAPLGQSCYNNSGESCLYQKFGSRRKEPVVGLVRALSISDSENVVTTGVVGGGEGEGGVKNLFQVSDRGTELEEEKPLDMKCVVWDKWHLRGLVRDVQEAVDVRAYNSRRRSPQGCGLRSHKT